MNSKQTVNVYQLRLSSMPRAWKKWMSIVGVDGGHVYASPRCVGWSDMMGMLIAGWESGRSACVLVDRYLLIDIDIMIDEFKNDFEIQEMLNKIKSRALESNKAEEMHELETDA